MAVRLRTNLQLVAECDNFPYPDGGEMYWRLVGSFYKFSLREEGTEDSAGLRTMGYILPNTALQMPWTDRFHVDHQRRTVTIKHAEGADADSDALRELLDKARELDSFKALRGWRNELYPFRNFKGDVRIERSGSALFGMETMGVHMTGFCRNPHGEPLIWVPRRAKTKQTYGGMLDNTVAGGIAAGESPFESIVREAAEEASLPEELVRVAAQPCGTISYFHIRDERAGGEAGLLQPETQYIYDIELPTEIIPKPSDDEVEEFYLWSVDEVRQALSEGEFKPNCAVCLIDFLIRHGEITAENEPNYREIMTRMHRRLRFE